MEKTIQQLSIEPTTINKTGLDLLFHRMAKSGKGKWDKYVPVKEKDCVDTFKGEWATAGDDCDKVDWE